MKANVFFCWERNPKLTNLNFDNVDDKLEPSSFLGRWIKSQQNNVHIGTGLSFLTFVATIVVTSIQWLYFIYLET